MLSKFSLHGLAARLLPSYSARYLDRLMENCNALTLPGDNQARALDSFYIPLRFRDVAAGAKSADLWDALFRSPRLVIVGEIGAGKTATLKYATVALAKQQMPEGYIRRLTFLHQGQAFDRLFPLYADLGNLDAQINDLPTFLGQAFAGLGVPGGRDLARAWLDHGGCALLLDNLDVLLTVQRQTQLVDLLKPYPRLQVVVAARDARGARSLPGFVTVEIQPFSAGDAAKFIGRRLGADTPVATALLQAIERDCGVACLAGNPLLLAVLTATSAALQQMPLRLPDLYDACWRALLPKHATKQEPQGSVVQWDRALQGIAHWFHERHQETFDTCEMGSAAGQVLSTLGMADEEQSFQAWLRECPLLRQDSAGRWSFLRLALQEYLTALVVVAMGGEEDLVRQHADDAWWHEVIVLVAALSSDTPRWIERLAPAGQQLPGVLFLAARCASESRGVPLALRERLIELLLLVFQDGDAAHWQAAASCLSALYGQRVRDYLLRMLDQGLPTERAQAAFMLGRVGAPDWAAVPLLGVVQGGSPEVRAQAAWALGQLRDKRAIQTLVAALRDEHEEVAQQAALALGAIGEPAVSSLILALGSEVPRVRQMAANALGAMGATVMPSLLNVLGDERQPDAAVKGAIEALGRWGDAQAIPALVRALSGREGRVAEPASQALAAIGAPAVHPLIAALPSHSAELALRQAIVSALATIGNPSIEPLIQALGSPSTSVRSAAEEALLRIGAPAVDRLLENLRVGDLNLRRRIAQILEHVGDERLAEPLLRMLEDQDPGVRARVVRILGQVGHEGAVEPLVQVMRGDPDELVRREAIRALAELRSERAVGPLLEVLRDPLLQDNAVAALVGIGEPAVEPLIEAINRGYNSGADKTCVKALSLIGAHGRVGEPSYTALARTYAFLLTEPLPHGTEQLIAQLEHIRWWPPGEELFQVFVCAQALAQARSLATIAQCPEKLDWVNGLEKPFHPALQGILWDLNNVAQSIRLYLHDTRREGRRDAMLSAINTMSAVQKAIDARLLDFEKRPFVEIVQTWQRLTNEALDGLRGRAQVEIASLRDALPLDSAQLSTTIVFSLTNVGDSAARNLSAMLKPSSGDGFEVIGESTQRLDPLGSGMQRVVEFRLRPLGVQEAAFAFEIVYDDDEGTGHRYPYSGRVRFFAVGDKYRPIPSSPYVMGLPVKTPQMFYGRQDVFEWIRENITGAVQQNILILHGERRMGKTSILYQLLNRPPAPQYICVFLSLELAITSSLGDLFYDMASEVYDAVKSLDIAIPEPNQESFTRNAQRAFRRFLTDVERAIGERRLLVMIDEVDIMIGRVEEGVLSADAFYFMRGIMQHSDKIAFLLTGAYKTREMLKDNLSILFNIARSYKISYLNPNEAQDLIRKPVAEFVAYDDLVVDKILRVSACHPYFVQYICDSLVKLARRARKNYVDLPDLDVVLQEVIQDNTGNLQRAIYGVLSRPEQRALAALANVTDDYRVFVPPDMVAQVLDQYKLGLSRSELADALRSLRERDLVVEKRIGQSLQYGFKMDLIRMWVRQNEVLLRISQEMRI